MNGEPWLDELSMLLERFSGLAISADIAALSLCELWGMYCYLRHLAEA